MCCSKTLLRSRAESHSRNCHDKLCDQGVLAVHSHTSCRSCTVLCIRYLLSHRGSSQGHASIHSYICPCDSCRCSKSTNLTHIVDSFHSCRHRFPHLGTAPYQPHASTNCGIILRNEYHFSLRTLQNPTHDRFSTLRYKITRHCCAIDRSQSSTLFSIVHHTTPHLATKRRLFLISSRACILHDIPTRPERFPCPCPVLHRQRTLLSKCGHWNRTESLCLAFFLLHRGVRNKLHSYTS